MLICTPQIANEVKHILSMFITYYIFLEDFLHELQPSIYETKIIFTAHTPFFFWLCLQYMEVPRLQGSNLSRSSDPSCCSDDTESLTCCAAGELPQHTPFNIIDINASWVSHFYQQVFSQSTILLILRGLVRHMEVLHF